MDVYRILKLGYLLFLSVYRIFVNICYTLIYKRDFSMFKVDIIIVVKLK